MHKGHLAAAVVLLTLSTVCITSTTIEVVQGKYGLASGHFWLAIVFHSVTGVGAAFLFVKAHAAGQKAQEGAPS